MANARIYFKCEDCPKWHEGNAAHCDQYNGAQLYEVTCPDTWVTDWYNLEWPHRDHA